MTGVIPSFVLQGRENLFRFVCTEPPITDYYKTDSDKAWKHGDVVNVKFLDGDWDVWDSIASIVCGAGGWNSVCGVNFAFEQCDNSPVRITFEGNGTWSYNGRQCLSVPTSMPTMSIHGTLKGEPEYIMQRTVNHLFGHALGFGHPYKAMSKVPWNSEKVYDYYMQEFAWGIDDVDERILGNLVCGCDNEHNIDDVPSVMNLRMDIRLMKNMMYNGILSNTPSRHDRERALRMYGPPAHDWHKKYIPSLWSMEGCNE